MTLQMNSIWSSGGKMYFLIPHLPLIYLILANTILYPRLTGIESIIFSNVYKIVNIFWYNKTVYPG